MENVSNQGNAYKNFLFSSSSLLTKVLVNFVSIVILARLLPAKDFGIYSILTFLFYLVLTLGCLSANVSIIKAEENINYVFTFWVVATFFFNIFSCVALYFFLTPITAHFGFELSAPSILLLLGSILFGSLANVGDSLSQKLGLFRSLRNLDIFSNVFSFGLLLPFSALWLKDYRAFLIALFSFSLLRFIFLYSREFSFLTFPKNLSDFRPAFRGFEAFFMISQLANFFALHLDNLIVGSRLGTASLGFYSRAYQLVSLPGVIIGDALDKVFFPHFKNPHSSHQSKHSDILICQSFLARFFLPLATALLVFSDDIVLMVLGPHWQEVGNILRVLSLAMFLKTSAKFLYSFLKANGSSIFVCVIQILYLCMIAAAAFVGSGQGLLAVAALVFCAIAAWWACLLIYVYFITKNKMIFGGYISDFSYFLSWLVFCIFFSLSIVLCLKDSFLAKILFLLVFCFGWFYFLQNWLKVAKGFFK